jgi:glycerate dehydrogenase
MPILDIPGILVAEEKILALDPDFCDWKVEDAILEKIPNLKAIVLQTTSFSYLNTELAKSKGIPVVNLRGFSTNAVAEWAILMALNVARKVPLVIKDGWKQDFAKHQGFELKGETAGVIGLGRNGTAIAERCLGLGMRVQYWSKDSHDERFVSVGLSELMETSDVIFPAFAKNEETEHLLSEELLQKMKKTAIFIQTVHVPQKEIILEMVKRGDLFGYGFEEGKGGFTNYEGNVWAGPELAWCTKESVQKNGEIWLEAIIQASKGDFPNQIN